MTFDEWNIEAQLANSECYFAARKAWDHQQAKIDAMERKLAEVRRYAEDCACRCPMESL